MFSNLFDLSYKRNFLGAVGFYIVSFILLIAISQFYRLIYYQLDHQLGTTISYIIGIGYSMGLALSVIIKKKLTDEKPLLLLVVLAGVLYILGGGTFLGLLPSAYLTTRYPHKKS